MNSNEMKLREKIKEPFQKLITESTSHGLPRIFKSKNWCTKLMWLFCFLVSATYCAYIIKITISDYLEYDFITSIEEYTQIPSLFPSITICNQNQFNSIKSSKFIRNYSNYSSEAAILLLLTEISELNNSAKQSLSYGLNEQLLKCSFNGRNCDESNFEWVYYPLNGNCFTFNGGYVSKANTGLYLELFTGNSDLTPAFIKSNGFHVYINNHTIKPMTNEIISVAPGQETSVNVNRVFNQKLPYPHNYCFSNLDNLDAFDSDLFRSIMKMNRTYRQKDCFDLCYQVKLINECDCYLINYDRLNGTKACLNIKQMECVTKTWKKFLASDLNKICSTACPLECDSMSFKLSISSLQFPNKLYGKKLMSNKIISSQFSNESLTYSDLKQSVLALRIIYSELTYTLISQNAKMQLFDLISNIGGLLGLFLGVSFLTLAEVIEAFLAIFEILIANFRSNKKRKNDLDNKLTNETNLKIEETRQFIENF